MLQVCDNPIDQCIFLALVVQSLDTQICLQIINFQILEIH